MRLTRRLPAIVAYVGAFVLIRYRLNKAEEQEKTMLTADPENPARAAIAEKRRPPNSSAHRPSASMSSTAAPPSPFDTIRDFPLEVFIDLRSLVLVERTRPLWFLRPPCGNHARANAGTGPRGKQDPGASAKDNAVATLEGIVGVLARAHTVCGGMTLLGFFLALLGILTYSWTAVPTSLGIFASSCMGVCGIAATIAFW